MQSKHSLPQLPCSDLERTKRFFLDQAGFECRTPQADLLSDVLVVGFGGVELQFWKVAEASEARAMARQTACLFEVSDLKLWMKQFETQGLNFITERQPWGALELSFKDPDGNSIRLAQSDR